MERTLLTFTCVASFGARADRYLLAKEFFNQNFLNKVWTVDQSGQLVPAKASDGDIVAKVVINLERGVGENASQLVAARTLYGDFRSKVEIEIAGERQLLVIQKKKVWWLFSRYEFILPKVREHFEKFNALPKLIAPGERPVCKFGLVPN